MSTNATVLLGASLGGALAAAPGPASVYALDAAGFGVSFALLGRLPALPPQGPGAPGDAGARSGEERAVLGEIWAGLRYAGSRKDLLGSYLADLAAMVFAYPNALIPFMSALLGTPWAAGLMFAAPSAGAFLVSVTSGWMGRVRRHGVAIAVSAACWGGAMAAFGGSPDLWAALALLAVAGGADEASAIFRDTLWNQTIPDELRGRMAGIELLSYAAGPPLGQLQTGTVAAVAGVRLALAAGGLACVAGVGAVCAALPSFRRYRAAAGAAGAPETATLLWHGRGAIGDGHGAAGVDGARRAGATARPRVRGRGAHHAGRGARPGLAGAPAGGLPGHRAARRGGADHSAGHRAGAGAAADDLRRHQ
jgi:hypothetical protein